MLQPIAGVDSKALARVVGPKNTIMLPLGCIYSSILSIALIWARSVTIVLTFTNMIS